MNLWKLRKPGKLRKLPDRTPLSSSPIERKLVLLLGKRQSTIATGASLLDGYESTRGDYAAV